MDRIEDDLVALEREGWEALRSGRAGAYYRERLAPEAVMVFGFGVLAREECIEAMESAPPWTSYDIQNPQVLALTEDSGIVVYRVSAHRSAQEPYTAMISSAFVRCGGIWQLAFHQQSPM